MNADRSMGALLQTIGQGLQDAWREQDAAAHFEPLKRLALHLACELVRAQWPVTPVWVDDLVRRCVQALGDDSSPVVVELHPLDLALVREALQGVAQQAAQAPQEPAAGAALSGPPPWWARVQWREDPALSRGSVRARTDHSTVEDLIEQRLASILQDLRVDVARWQAGLAVLAAGAAPARPPDAQGTPDA